MRLKSSRWCMVLYHETLIINMHQHHETLVFKVVQCHKTLPKHKSLWWGSNTQAVSRDYCLQVFAVSLDLSPQHRIVQGDNMLIKLREAFVTPQHCLSIDQPIASIPGTTKGKVGWLKLWLFEIKVSGIWFDCGQNSRTKLEKALSSFLTGRIL